MDEEAPHSEVDDIDRQDGVLLFNERRYAVGLTWLTSDAESDPGLVKDRASRLSADFYCVRSSLVNQQGFGYLSKGHRMNMASAASIAADALVGEWHGIFAADNGWWYLGIHSDAIAPDGDQLFFSEEDAYNFFIQKSEEHKWPRSYAPAAWNLPDVTGDIPIERLLSDPGGGVPLRPVNMTAIFGGGRQKQIAVLALVVVMVLAVLTAVLPAMMSDIADRQKSYVVAVETDAPDIIKPPPPPPVELKEDLSKITFSNMQFPVPSEVIKACSSTFESVIHPLPGWELVSAKCDGRQVEVVWRRVTGSLDLIKESVGLFPARANRNYSGKDRFTVSLGVLSRDVPVRTIGFPKRDEVIFQIDKRFSSLGTLNLAHVIPPAPKELTTQRGIKAAPPPSQPQYLELELDSQFPPTKIASYFDVDGLRLHNINWVVGSGKWQYQARIYIDSK